MVEKLKSVLKTPKLRLGAKAFILALALYALPVWMAVLLALILYFRPTTFSLRFLGSLISLLIVFNAFQDTDILSPIFISILTAGLFYILLGVKNMAFFYRLPAFFALFAVIVFASLWGFFAGALSLIFAVFIIFLICRDVLYSFMPLSNRSTLLAFISAFIVAQLAWAIFYLSIPVFWSTIAVFLIFAGIFYLIIQHLRGTLFRSEAPFIAVAIMVATLALLIMVVF